MKILLAADGSKYTSRAIQFLQRHRDSFTPGAELVVLHVQPALPGRAAAALSRATVAKWYRDETDKALALSRRALGRKSMPFEEVMLVGDAGAVIAAYAKKEKFDLVVMGSHGHGALSSLVLGSVASKVLARCDVPVLLVR